MALLTYADRVAETTTTTGTGTIQLLGAVDAKFRTFVAGVGSGNTAPYVMVHRTANEWEVGYGVVTSGGPNTLTRAGIYASSNSGSAVSFSAGTKDVFLALPGSKTVRFDDATGGIAVDGTTFVVDATNDRVGIGTASPAARLHTVGPASNSANLIVQGDNGNATAFWISAKANSTFHIGGSGSTEPASGAIVVNASGNFECAGVYSATVGGTNRDVYVDNTGLLGYVSSIRAAKTNIEPLIDTDWLLDLAPVAFNYRKKDENGEYTDEVDGIIEYGLIAEDTETVKPELCFYDIVDGEPELRGINYSKLIVPMLKRIQALEARLAALEGAA